MSHYSAIEEAVARFGLDELAEVCRVASYGDADIGMRGLPGGLASIIFYAARLKNEVDDMGDID